MTTTSDSYCAVKADTTHRCLAKVIDLIIAMALWKVLPTPIGFFAATVYLLIGDGMPPRGQSLGKRLIGLRVVITPSQIDPPACAWKQSMIRNIPFVLCCFSTVLGFLGMLIFIVGIVLIAFETYFIFSDDQGIRLGDIFANTKVLDA